MTQSSSSPQPIPPKNDPAGAGGGFFSSSFGHGSVGLAGSPLAEQVLARDLAECHEDHSSSRGRGTKSKHHSKQSHENAAASDSDSDSADPVPGPTLYRRPSGIAYGATRPTAASLLPPASPAATATPAERARSRDAERSLLRDNHLLPPKHPRIGEPPGLVRRAYEWMFSTKVRGGTLWHHERDEEEGARGAPAAAGGVVDETSPLLGSGSGAGSANAGATTSLNEQWEAAVAAGAIRTTWQREAKTIAVYSRSLVVTFLLQYSLNVTSILAVGRLGTVELGAVSLASMTATITCYAPIQGLATCLDTLCAQAYGSGHKHLVGLQLQRMTYFLLLTLIPVAAVWLNAETILVRLKIHEDSAALAATYLRIVLLGTPAYAAFVSGDAGIYVCVGEVGGLDS
jgi:MATE family multidrug resistance protein